MINRIFRLAHRFADGEDGATAIEYAAMAVLLGVPLLALSTPIRNELAGLLGSVADAMAAVLAGNGPAAEPLAQP